MPRSLVFAVSAIVPLVAACSSPIKDTPSLPPPRVIGVPAGVPLDRPPAGDAAWTAASPQQPTVAALQKRITVEAAVAQVLASSPELAAAAEAVRAKEGEARQASLWLNPELVGEVENFAGSGEAKDFDTAEYTLSLAQPLDLSGKVRRRALAADYERRLAGWEYETIRLDLLTATRRAHAEVTAAQQNVTLARELAQLADNLAEAVRKRVQAGKVSPVEMARIDVVQTAARTEALRAAQELATARAALVALWGEGAAPSEWVAVEDRPAAKVPDPRAVEPLLAQTPEAARWADELALRETEFAFAQAGAVQDVTASLGVRRFAETDDNALVAGLSVPLPVFDRNQGAVAAAAARRVEAERRRSAFRARQKADFQAAYNTLKAADLSARSLDDRIIPSARSVFSATTSGYQAGKFSLIELLDAQRTLFEAQVQGVAARAELAKAQADFERLIAHPADAPAQPKPGS